MRYLSKLLALIMATLLAIAAIWIWIPSFTMQLIATIAIGFVWLVTGSALIIRFILQSKTLPTPLNYNEQQTCQLFRDNIKHAWQQLKKSGSGSFWQRRQRPWVLLLGPKSSGKTALLANADLPLCHTAPQQLNTLRSTQRIDWWITEDTVFVDPNGRYALPATDDLAAAVVWQKVMQACRSYAQSRLKYLVLVLDYATLIQHRDQIPALAQRFMQQIHPLQMQFGHLQIQIIITQCDRMAGFTDYFADQTAEEREQPLGFALVQDHEHSLIEQFNEQSHQLLKQLHQRLVWRLHHEQNLQKRHHIKDFPLQMDALNDLLRQLIEQLPWDRSALTGVFFTSSLQQGNSINVLAKTLSDECQLSVAHKPPRAQQLAYFSRQIFKTITAVLPTRSAKKISVNWARLLTIPAAAIVVGSLALLWHVGFQQNIKTLNHLQQNLATVSESSALSKKMPWLEKLNILNATLTSAAKQHNDLATFTGLIQSHQLKASVRAIYQRILKNQFKAFFLQALRTSIQQAIPNDKVALYSSLRAYLMLTTPERFNAKAVLHWFTLYLRQQYPKQLGLQQQLHQHLQHLLRLKLQWTQDKKLVSNARQVLNQVSKAQFAFIELQGEYPSSNIPITNAVIPGFNLSQATIPAFYHPAYFKTILNKKIPAVSLLLTKDNWVLGGSKTNSLTPQQEQQLTQQVKALYLQYYSKQWLGIMANVQVAAPNNIGDLLKTIQLLQQPNSPLIKLANGVLNNIQLALQSGATQVAKDPRFIALQAFAKQTDHFAKAQPLLKNLSAYLQKINQANSVNKASYDAASDRFVQHGKGDPITDLLAARTEFAAPLQGWLTSIAHSSWTLLLANTHLYLNSIWQRLVLPFYQQKINGLFPIFKNSAKDISFQSMRSFFGPNGTMEVYFNYLLKPFVNTSGNFWVWKQLDGQSLPISQAHLNMFLRASLIQKMFFTNNPKSPSMKLQLQLKHLSKGLTSFVLNLGGQNVIFQATTTKPTAFSWPGPDADFVTIGFNTKDQHPTVTKTGPWAWLRLLNTATLGSTTNARVFTVTFKLAGQSASFELIADNPINPYLPGILYQFRCPKSL